MTIPGIYLLVRLTTGTPREAADAAEVLLEHVHQGEPLSLSVDDEPDRRVETLDVAEDATMFVLRWKAAAGQFQLLASEHILRGWTIRLRLEPGEDVPAARDALARVESALTALAPQPGMFRAQLERPRGGWSRLPDIGFDHAAWLVLPRHWYTDWVVSEEALFESGWESVELLPNGKVLLRRATIALLATEYRQAIEAHAWALARIALPDRIKIDLDEMPAEEWPIHRSGPGRLERVGFDGDVLELSCILAPGEHIPGWEICELGLEARAHPVRVVFMHEDQARGEARPLIAVGARVFYMGGEAQLVEIA